MWTWVRHGLEKVSEKCAEPLMPEDVWASLKVGGATLYVYYDSESERNIGFAVMQRQAGMDGPMLFVWASWFEPMKYRRFSKELLAHLDDAARSIGAKEIRHHSNRIGWGHGGDFVQHSIIWRREVLRAEQSQNTVKEQQWEAKAAAAAAVKP